MKKNYSTFFLLVFGFILQNKTVAQCASTATLGLANNMVGLLRNNGSAIAANKLLNTITFVHRNHVATFGGNSGNLRFDVSTNGGATWATNIGPINPASSSYGRYPNIAIYNPAANTNTANAYISYLAPTIGTATSVFNGDVSGVSNLGGTGITESYNQNGIGTTYIPASLVTGSAGVMWAIEPLVSTSGYYIYKGVWSSSISDFVWSINYTVTPSFSYFPSPVTSDYNIAFDPTGTTGYICFTGQLTSGPTDATLYPILYKTLDGGATWTGPITVDVTKFGCINSNTVTGNFASMNTNHDLVVDVNGNPHIVTTLGNSSGYTFNYSYWHHMYDITLKNGLWVAYDLGNVNCGSNIWGGTTTFAQAQAPQASRSADGSKLFFTWVDNSSSSLGSNNSSPNLFGKGYNVVSDTWTQTKDFTSCNTAIAGKMLFPHSAAEALEPNSTTYLVPSMYGEPSVTNDLDQTANFRYLDNITFVTSEFSLTVPAATVTITPPAPLIVCSGSSVTLSVGSIAQAIWSNSATTTSISITSGTTTTYSVIAQVGCNVGTASISVSNLTLAASALTASICPGGTANFSVVGNALGYTWTPGSVSGASVTLNPSTNIVTLTAMGSGSCLTTQTVPVNILALPSVTIIPPTGICPGGGGTFSVTGNAVGYTWTPGGASGTSVTLNPSPNIVTLTAIGIGSCLTTQTVTVNVFSLPTLTITGTSSVCPGSLITEVVTGAQTYSWNGGSTNATFTDTPLVNTSYTVTGTDANGCVNTKTVSVVMKPTPTLVATGSPTAICMGESTFLSASGAVSYSWITVASTNNATVTPASTTVYTVTGTGTNSCQSTKTVIVTVNPLPSLTVTPGSLFFCKGEKVKLTASGADTYTWSSPVASGSTVQVSPANTATYNVSGTSSVGCMSNKVYTLTVNPCTGLNEQEAANSRLLIYPNPNAGSFTIKGESNITLQIHNELGQVVKTLSLNETNSREISVQDLSAGIYFVMGQTNGIQIKQKIVISK